MACPCGRGPDYESCCKPIHDGTPAPTAEALMRARYTAYAKGNIDYLEATHRPPSGEEIDREATERWSKESEWTGLEIVGTEKGSETDDEGVVEFVARWRAGGHDLRHHERSIFKKIDGKWLYVDGKEVKPPPAKSTKVGRNDVCPCGSGKKYKRCHGAS